MRDAQIWRDVEVDGLVEVSEVFGVKGRRTVVTADLRSGDNSARHVPRLYVKIFDGHRWSDWRDWMGYPIAGKSSTWLTVLPDYVEQVRLVARGSIEKLSARVEWDDK